MVLCQDNHQVPYHGMDLSCLCAIAFRHSVHHYCIDSEWGDVESEACKKVCMLAYQAHVLDPDLHGHREEGGLSHMLILRHCIQETVIEDTLHRAVHVYDHEARTAGSDYVFSLKGED